MGNDDGDDDDDDDGDDDDDDDDGDILFVSHAPEACTVCASTARSSKLPSIISG